MLGRIFESLETHKQGIVLLEYSSLDHPELVFADILNLWREKGINPLIVDIGNTLHIFIQHLRFKGIELDVDDVPVIKELGKARVGNVIGEISEVNDFDYHMAKYALITKKVPEESGEHTVVLGIEKFSFTFMDNPPKLERYFERITRSHLKFNNGIHILFLNVSMASPYFIKSLEQDCEYVLGVENGVLKRVKVPGGDIIEVP
nr:DUF257 family protein [Thermococcus sp. Bubb.Bath]